MGCSCCGQKYIPPAGSNAPRQGVVIVGARRHISIPKPKAPAQPLSTPPSEEKK